MSKKARVRFIYFASLTLVVAALSFPDFTVSAQKRPKSTEEGKVEIKSRPTKISRPVRSSIKATKASNSVLIVQTDPEDAEVKIDNQPGERATRGEFSKELPMNKQYLVTVSAGPEYGTFQQRVMLSQKYKIIGAPLTSKFGVIKLGPVKPGGTVRVDDKPIPENRLKREDNLLVVDGLPPGQHEITYDHPNYLLLEKLFPIEAGKEYLWTFILEEAIVPLTVKTDAGASVYIDNEFRGNTPASGTLTIKEVPIGDHDIKLSRQGYEEHTERRKFEIGKPVEIIKSLTPVATSAEFVEDFDLNLAKWSVPGASVARSTTGRLNVASAATLAQPRAIRYRDFIMQFHLKLENGGGAAWAVRVKDSNNYYLFYLSGPQGVFPNRFLVYIVRDGKYDQQAPASQSPVITELVAGGQYTIEIKAVKDRIEHKITPSSTGAAENLGFYQDSGNTFPLGGIGFRTVGSEKFSIDDLIIQSLR